MDTRVSSSPLLYAEILRKHGGKLLSPAQRCRAVERLQQQFRVSQRRACRLVGQPRSTQRRPRQTVNLEEEKLRRRLREIAAEHIRWGRRKAYDLLRREGFRVNHKRVQRLWREEGLQRPQPANIMSA